MNSAGLSSWKVVEDDRPLRCSPNHSLEENLLQDGARFTVGYDRGFELGQHSRRILRVEEAGPTSPAAMDPRIWGNLPVHILESILAWLPVSTLLKLRCVCKRFNNILHSPTLRATLRRINRPRSVQAWYLFRGEGRECAAFNPEADSWCKLPLQALNLPSSATGIRVVAAAGGLLCLRQGERMIVCNPLSKAWRELPPRQNTWKFPIVGMVMDTEIEEYVVVMAGSANPNTNGKKHDRLVTEVYSSRSKTWKSIEEDYPAQHLYQTNAVHCNGFLFSAGFESILAYNLEQERWRELKGPAMQDAQLMLPQICECNGCLLMVEVASEHWLMTRVSIWALQQQNNRWINLASMPQQILEEVISIAGTRLFTYYGYGDLVCFTIARRRVLVFSMSRRRWRWLPRCPFVRGFARRCTALAYEPRVEAVV
ncbi:hypothetical protein KC19_1G057600 [Ceratodon purpureus]|uniref:F-box domain-containing protein n=1 Tax=Ceratodon purpureus TaxID=3225 RepID=A0A8T0J4C7_CERPU|nr:hypothetical protein KC19_1G057600 [Ceratodon purpureus]KAG0589927.1 hypothetical protein KC19_1G057600 [Ceratodon purpureus]KAG0589928.1 hypothetical protein KC19_1G057600 [Ceratodon purpureus]KAG0589929.1 hypothetical protein KC19_1G057600 [Ceratodon purpureus]KAG0589930.1 hypothetical protein KC19_1G057600 [Ceratodon purpureus]